MPATSEAIPRAVEFLILLLLRWACFGLAGAAGLLAVAAWRGDWPAWAAAIPAGAGAVALAVGAAIRPRGRVRWDRDGPSVVVPSRPAGGGRAGPGKG
jgi:hypothetical protein